MSIPTVDYERLVDPVSQQKEFETLRKALIHVGFFYLKNHPISRDLLNDLETQARKFFELPMEEKLKCEMIRSKHFLGYSRLANEITAKQIDWREQVDLGTELKAPNESEIKDETELYKNLVGPNLWPNGELLPNYRPTIEKYFAEMTKFHCEFLKILTQSIGLPPGSFDQFFNKDLSLQHHKMKLVYYPDNQGTGQGVGPHRDSGFITFIHQATPQNSLQVLDYSNKWVDVPPVPETFVVAVGQTLEFITEGVIKATVHRALSPVKGQGTRLSIPFFIGMDNKNYKARLSNLPQDLLDERNLRDSSSQQEPIEFQFTPDLNHPVGYVNFANRVKSHPDVAKRWYGSVAEKIIAQSAK